ncbi:MAG TPA: MBL fold metallo-hydrolase [Polyangiaceae bacterium]
MRVFVLSSGSSGNALLLEANCGSRVFVDAGVGPKVAARRLKELGFDLFPRGVDAIVITHHHGDHFAHAEPLARAFRAPMFLHRGISARRVRARWEVREYQAGAPFQAGAFEVQALDVPHDAPQVALTFEAGGLRFGLATDLGRAPSSLAPFLGRCDVALLEANYCPLMLETGPYPPRLRDRIRGGLGHLANEQTAELAARFRGMRLATLCLGHISRHNNSPEQALAVVRPRCPWLEVFAVAHGDARTIEVGAHARPAFRGRGEQLALAFG